MMFLVLLWQYGYGMGWLHIRRIIVVIFLIFWPGTRILKTRCWSQSVLTCKRMTPQAAFLICALLFVDSVSNLQHAFKVYAQMHVQDPLLALLLYLDLDIPPPNLSSRPTGVAGSSSTSGIPSSSSSIADADSAFRRVTEPRKGSSKWKRKRLS